MKIQYIELDNWRKHASKRIEFDDRATVVYGPNETGKSTILEALHRGLFDRYSSSAQEIQRVKPITVLGGVGSTVRIRFSVSSGTYQLEKTFNYNPGSKLYRVRNNKLELVAKDDPADKAVLDMLEAEMQTRKASEPSKWGAFYWLWTLQDKRELPRDGNTSALKLNISEGKVLMTPMLEAVRNNFDKKYSEYFTPTTGKLTNKSPVLESKRNLDALVIESQRLTLQINTVDGYLRDLESKIKGLPAMEKSLEDSRNKLTDAVADSRDYVKIESDLKTSEALLNEIKGKIGVITEALEQLKGSANKIASLRRNEAELRDKLFQAQARAQYSERLLNDVTEQVDLKTKELSERDLLLDDSRVQYSINENQNKIKEFEEKVTQIEQIEGEIKSLKSKEKQLLITEDELLALEKDSINLESYKKRLSNIGLSVERTLGKNGALSIRIDDNELDKFTPSGSAVNKVDVYYEGLGQVSISADIAKARDLKSDIERLEKRVNDALKQNGADTVQVLRKVFIENQKIMNNIEKLTAKRTGIDERSKEDLQSELDSLKKKNDCYKSITRDTIAIEKNPLNDLSALVALRSAERKRTDEELNLLRKKRDAQKDEYNSKRNDERELNIKHENNNNQISEALEEQQELINKYGSEKNQGKLLSVEEEKLKNEQKKKDELETQYNKYKEGPLAVIKRLENTISNQEQILMEHRASIEQLRGKIMENSLDGAYSQLSQIEPEIEELEEKVKFETIRAESIKILKDVLQEQYNKNIVKVTEPIKQDVKSYLAYVTGNLHGDVEIDDHLFPTKLGEQGVDQLLLDYVDASSGLREVLGLCIRLALARHLCKTEQQCIVLDDPFVHVSTDRSERMVELINRVIDEAGLQAIILTHRPVEFSGFTGKMVDIQK